MFLVSLLREITLQGEHQLKDLKHNHCICMYTNHATDKCVIVIMDRGIISSYYIIIISRASVQPTHVKHR